MCVGGGGRGSLIEGDQGGGSLIEGDRGGGGHFWRVIRGEGGHL